MSGIIGKKIGMSSVFNTKGELVPVTVIQAGPCKVVSIRTKEKDGYEALRLGYGTKKEKNLSKPVIGQFSKNNLSPSATIKEFEFSSVSEYNIGDEINVSLFKEGEKIKVRGRSKGKGFQGVVKRYGFSGVGGATHGQSDRLRAPGSIGASSFPSRVFKGQRMAGRKGFDNVTITHLKIVRIFAEDNIILVKGAIPGSANTIVELIKN